MAIPHQNTITSCSSLLPQLASLMADLLEQLQRDPKSDATSTLDAAAHGLREIERRLETTQHAGTRGSCVLRGVSPAISVESLLTFLSINHRTGTLRVATPDENVTLHLVAGDIVHGYSDHQPEGERLGDLLVSRGAIGSETLEQFLDKHADPHTSMGEALERDDLIDAAEIRAALEQQTHRLIQRICAAEEASFDFCHAEAAVPTLHIRTKILKLLLESERAQGEEEASQADGESKAP